MNHLATPAISRWASASSHSSLAALRHCWERLSEFSSNSCSDCVEQDNRYSNGGRGGVTSGLRVLGFLPGLYYSHVNRKAIVRIVDNWQGSTVGKPI